MSDPHLIDVLQGGLMRFHRQIPAPDSTRFPHRYAHLIQSQAKIGWGQLYMGRWSKEWGHAQSAYMTRRGGSWYSKYATTNDTEQTSNAKMLLVGTDFTSELTELYTYRTKVCPVDRKIFYDSAVTHLHKHPSLDSIENWIATHRDAIKASVAQAVNMGLI